MTWTPIHAKTISKENVYAYDFGPWQGRVTEDLKYYTDDGFECKLNVDVERHFSKRWFFRTSGSVDWYEEQDGLPHALSFRLYHVLNRHQALQYEVSNYFDTAPSYKMTDLQLRARYRQCFYRDWLIVEVSPEISFPYDPTANPIRASWCAWRWILATWQSRMCLRMCSVFRSARKFNLLRMTPLQMVNNRQRINPLRLRLNPLPYEKSAVCAEGISRKEEVEMKTMYLRFFCMLIMFFSVGMYHSSTASAAKARVPKPATPENGRQMTQEELQSAVISYANRFIAIIGQAAVQFEEAISTDQARLNAARRKVYSMTAVVETAAGPNPGSALLDLVVNATLSRMVWEDYWSPQIFGKPAAIMVEAFKKMEVDAWDLAAEVMTSEQRQEFRDLIDDWYADHPGQVSVDYVTFSDFGGIGTKPNLKNIQKPGGLLAPIREATAAVDDVRMTVERAMFLLPKMQLIMGSQVELVYRNLVMQPEMKTILADFSGLKETADRYALLLEELPLHVTNERKAILNAIDDKATAIHNVNTDIQATLEQADLTMKSLQQTTIAANHLIASTDALLAWFDPDVSIDDYIKAIEAAQEAISGFNQLISTVDQTGMPLISTMLDQFNQSAEERVDHIFWRLLTLIAAAGGIGLVMLTIYCVLKRRSK